MEEKALESTTGLMVRKAHVIKTLHLPFFLFDLAGTVTYANSGACSSLGYTEEELVGTNISDLDTALSDDIWRQISESICEEKSLNYESHIYHRDGRVIPYEFRFQYCEDADGDYIGALAFDIADRKNVEGDIIAARESALESALLLKEKTRIAEEALNRVNQLKQKQDGDYYLTSLLLEPFQVNRTHRRDILIDWLVRQKTQFTYRKWHAEIGGDFCMAESLTLMGRDHTLFVIADAMGKANQGASGALILATIISTYVNRTRKTQHLGGLYPERWLRLLFDELHAGFEGFDGMMMIGTVIGLVDEESQYMYFINAEQPRPVSYHAGQAVYIGTATPRPKIGMPGDREQPSIELYHLQPDEIVIFGSDGRDDIRLHGGLEVNYDDALFLSYVKNAKGDLKTIRELTEKSGEIIDDYSLLSVRRAKQPVSPESKSAAALMAYYREHQELSALETLLEKEPNHVQALAILSNYYMKRQDAENCISFLHRYSTLRPQDLKAIYNLTMQYCRIRSLHRAADIAERVTYRVFTEDELQMRNKILSLLAEIYGKLKNPREAAIRDKIMRFQNFPDQETVFARVAYSA